ncbi:O-antigen ligase family protein [Vibrio aquaticus]|nr:O-antigen ligase family protein [Vibrio aquaticus]
MSVEAFICLLPIVWSLCVIYNIPNTKHLQTDITLLTSVFCLIKYRGWRFFRDGLRDNFFLFIFLSMTFLSSLFYAYHFLNGGHSDLPRALLLCAFYILFVPKHVFSINNLIIVVLLSSLSVFFGFFYEIVYLDNVRLGSNAINPIPYSFYVGFVLFLCLMLARVSLDEGRSKVAILLVFCSFPLFFAILYTGTRATLLAIACALIFYFLRSAMIGSKVNALWAMLFFLLMSLFLSQVPIAKNRTIETVEQLTNYSDGGAAKLRVNMWLTGIQLAGDKPWLGYSRDELQLELTNGIESGLFPAEVEPFLVHSNPHFHNQFVQFQIDSGLLGLLSMLVFVFSPLLICLFLKEKRITELILSFQIFSIVCLWFDSLYLHNHSVYLMCFFVFIVALLSEKKLRVR